MSRCNCEDLRSKKPQMGSGVERSEGLSGSEFSMRESVSEGKANLDTSFESYEGLALDVKRWRYH